MKKTYPYFITPDEHRLHERYKKMDRRVLMLALGLILINEVWIRGFLEIPPGNKAGIAYYVAIFLNGKIPLELAGTLHAIMLTIAVLFFLTFSQLPRSGERPLNRALRSGLLKWPEEFASANFYITSTRNRIAFAFWHSFLMRIAYCLGVCIPCMFLNMFRS
jgi:hypothetical protein